MKYSKSPLKHEKCLELLISERKLIIDPNKKDYYIRKLDSIGYYRLSGYMFHLQEANNADHIFKEGVTFDRVINTYNFDKKLRILFLEYIERIEVCLRSKISNHYSIDNNNFFWYIDSKYFNDKDQYVYNKIKTDIKNEFNNPKELFLKKFKQNYSNEFPPCNMAFETLSFGVLVKLFEALVLNDTKKAIAKEFGSFIPLKTLNSWFKWLYHIRNLSAHHNRLWNRNIHYNQPSPLKREKYGFKTFSNTSCYCAIYIIELLLRSFNPNNSFIGKIEHLLDEYNDIINPTDMGFPSNWKEEAAWKKN